MQRRGIVDFWSLDREATQAGTVLSRDGCLRQLPMIVLGLWVVGFIVAPGLILSAEPHVGNSQVAGEPYELTLR
jgi:hypothetical protein